MKTATYPNRVRSPIHPAKQSQTEAFNVQNEDHPAREEIERCVGEYNIKAVVEEDTQTLMAMKKTPGLISFLCTILKDGRVVAQGHGSSILNPNNRFLERAVHSAFNSALADGIIRATKVLDNLRAPADIDTETLEDAYQVKENKEAAEPATQKQQEYLRKLIVANVPYETEREQMLANVEEVSKAEASKMIESFSA